MALGIAGAPIPKHWEETIAGCLAKAREQRPRSAADVARRLRLPGTIRLTTPRETAKPVFRHYVKLSALAGAAIVLLGVAIAIDRSGPSAPRTRVLTALKKEAAPGYTLEAPAKIISIAKTEEQPSIPVPPPADGSQNATLQLSTTPPGASFAIYPGVVASKTLPATPPLRSGAAPESVADLPPGRYTVFFQLQGWPDDRTEVAVQPGEALPVEYTFPYGTVTITSIPDSAEIFAGENSLGHTPLTINLPLGKQTLTAHHPDFPKKTEIVTIENQTPTKVLFQLRARSHSSSTKRKEPESAWDKVGNSLKKIFSSKPPPKKKRER
jgi:hypothetical protein